MEGNAENGGGRGWRVAAWGGVVLLLLLPLVAMRFSDEVNWSGFDFAVAGALLFGTGLGFELVVRRAADTVYRVAAGVALVAALLLMWVSMGVGIIGADGDPANLMYFGVLAVGIVGALIGRFQPAGMARALVAMAGAQVVVAVIAVVARLGATVPLWPLQIVGVTGLFVALWLAAAWLFGKAAGRTVASG